MDEQYIVTTLLDLENLQKELAKHDYQNIIIAVQNVKELLTNL